VHRRALLSILRWQKSVLRVVAVFGQLLDLVDERFCTAPEAVFRALVDGLIVEFGVVQHRLDLAASSLRSTVMSPIRFR